MDKLKKDVREELAELAEPHGTHRQVLERFDSMLPFLEEMANGTWRLGPRSMDVCEQVVGTLTHVCRFERWRFDNVHQVSLSMPVVINGWMNAEAYRRGMDNLRLAILGILHDSMNYKFTWHRELRRHVGTEIYCRLGKHDVRRLKRILNDEDTGIARIVSHGVKSLLGITRDFENSHIVHDLQHEMRKAIIMTHLYELGFEMIGDRSRADEIRLARKLYKKTFPAGLIHFDGPERDDERMNWATLVD